MERFNRTLATQLAIIADYHQRSWDRYLPLVLWTCRVAVQKSTGLTPAQMMMRHELRIPTDLIFGLPAEGEETMSAVPYINELRARMATVHQTARQNQGEPGLQQKQAYDMRCPGEPLSWC